MRGASIQIGVGALVAGVVGFAWGETAVIFSLLIFAGAVLIGWGFYDDFIKPRFRVERRITEWLIRRGWGVKIQRMPQFNFLLHITAPDSEKEIIVTRNKDAADDVLAFSARVGLDPRWLPGLMTMTDVQRRLLIQEITIFLTAKDVGLVLNDPRQPGSPIGWPPDVKLQTALPQDHTLSQHSVDLAAKKIEASMIGVRAIIRKAMLKAMSDDGGNNAPNGQPPPESTPDTASTPPQSAS